MKNQIFWFMAILMGLCIMDASGQVYKVDTLMYSGRTDNRVNLVILGDGYQAHELADFDTAALDLAEYVLNQPPLAGYQNFFNVFAISVPSNESGAALDPSMLIDNYYGSTYNFAGIDRLLVPTRGAKARDVLIRNFPEYDQVMMVVNHTKYGGSGGWMATTSIHNSASEIAAHEIGHSFSNLRDEYWAGPQYARESQNMTKETDPDSVIWNHWVGDQEVGVYPFAEDMSWHRPHQNCKMRRLGPAFCAVCTEAFVERIHELVNPIDSYEPESSLLSAGVDDTLTFSLDLVKPAINSLSREWYLNGVLMGEDSSVFMLPFDSLAEGRNVLEAYVLDTTVYSRRTNTSNRLSWVLWEIDKDVSTAAHGHQGYLNYRIWPNPAGEEIHYSLKGTGEISLWTMDGKLVEKRKIDTGEGIFRLPSSSAQIYMLKLKIGARIISLPVVTSQ